MKIDQTTMLITDFEDVDVKQLYNDLKQKKDVDEASQLLRQCFMEWTNKTK